MRLFFSLLLVSVLLKADAPAPAFELRDFKGQVWTEKSGETGLLLLDFWASWCAPCLKEVPALNALEKKYGPSGKLRVLGLSVDERGEAVARAAAGKRGMFYATAWAEGELAEKYKVEGLPTAFLIKKGRIIKTLAGGRNLKGFEKELAPFLK
jgi:thiol-disulfide isomerase/thioredoxin